MTEHGIDDEEAAGAHEDEDVQIEVLEVDVGPELADTGIVRRCLAEFLGTFLLALAVVSPAFGGQSGPVTSPLVLGVVVAALFFVFGPVSGGHFNPVVTAALGLLGKIGGPLAWVYICAQFAGGIAANALAWAIRTATVRPDASKGGIDFHTLEEVTQAMVGKNAWFPIVWPLLLLLSAFLVIVVLTARAKFAEGPQAGAWIGAGFCAVSYSTGAGVDPAISLPATVIGSGPVQSLLVLFFFPLFGAYLGALLYRELVASRDIDLYVEEDDDAGVEDEEAERRGETGGHQGKVGAAAPGLESESAGEGGSGGHHPPGES